MHRLLPYPKKKILEKKKGYPRPSTWNPRPRAGTLDPSTLDPRQKDRLSLVGCFSDNLNDAVRILTSREKKSAVLGT